MRNLLISFSFLICLSNYLVSQTLNEFYVDSIKKEMLVVPIDYELDKSIQLIGTVKSGDPTFLKVADYKTQLDKVCLKADAIGGNIIMITDLDNRRLTETYKLKANVYKCFDFKLTKDSMINIKNKSKFSGVVLYRPNNTNSLNDLFDFSVIVNNEEYLMKRSTKHFINIEKDQIVEIMVKGSNDKIKIDFKDGQTNYLKCLAFFPNSGLNPGPNTIMIPIGGYVPRVDLMNINGQGEIESKLINSR